MHTAQDVADVLESIAPRDSGVPGDSLGFHFGDPRAPVRGVACMWNIHTRSLSEAVGQGLNMVICHEALFLPAQESPWYQGPAEADIAPNQMRRAILEQHQMVVYRAHSNWDALPADGVTDQAVAALGIAGLELVARQKFFRVDQLPGPMSVSRLMGHVRTGLGYRDCRAFGNVRKKVSRFSLLIGGFGENQRHIAQAARDMGAEALILGEMNEFIVIAALEMGLPVIESLHSASESPAIRRQAQLLAQRLPDLPVRYVPSGATAFG
jgi:putative NIF3 family GTP cyclohydrolase 1 type 2